MELVMELFNPHYSPCVISEVPIEGWPLLVDRFAPISGLAMLSEAWFPRHGIDRLYWSPTVQQ